MGMVREREEDEKRTGRRREEDEKRTGRGQEGDSKRTGRGQEENGTGLLRLNLILYNDNS